MTIQFEELAKLHHAGLHESIDTLVSLMLSLEEYRRPERVDYQTVVNKYQMLVYQGDALLDDEQCKRAENCYTEALKLRKSLSRLKPASTAPGKQTTLTSELDVKYRIYQCHMRQKDYQEALTILDSIPLKQRTTKVHMKLAKLYHRQDHERSAVTCYKEVLRASPLSVDAAVGLLQLGVSFNEVTQLINLTFRAPDWLVQYLKGVSFSCTSKYTKAVPIFKQLEQQSLADCPLLLASMGEACWRGGEKANANQCFQRIRCLDKSYLQGMDIYSQILADDGKIEALERLSQELHQVSQTRTEPWLSLAHYCACTNRKTKAVYFAQKAHILDVRNVQALLLKAALLKSLSKQDEALIHYREAIRLAPNFFLAYKGLVDCYVTAEKYKEAMSVARNALKTIGQNARTYTLCAKVYSHDHSSQDKMKAMLQKALNMDGSFLPAVYMMSDGYIKDEQYSEALEILQKQLLTQRTYRLHQLVGDCLKELGKQQEAMEHYSKAIRLNPSDARSLSGISNVERDASGIADLDMSGLPRDRGSMEDLVEDASYELQWMQ